jgi:hypothetical protein
MELVEELVKAERDLAYAESTFDRIGRLGRKREVGEARAALTAELACFSRAAVMDVGFLYEKPEDVAKLNATPTVLVCFPINDYDARDAFARVLRDAGANAGKEQT